MYSQGRLIFRWISVAIPATATARAADEPTRLLHSFACATHAVFSPPAAERLSADGLFEQVVVTNSIPIPSDRVFPQLQVLSVANMLGEAIWRIHEESSVSSMFR